MFANRLQCEVGACASASDWVRVRVYVDVIRDDICSAYVDFHFYFELVEWLKLNPFKLAFFSVRFFKYLNANSLTCATPRDRILFFRQFDFARFFRADAIILNRR